MIEVSLMETTKVKARNGAAPAPAPGKAGAVQHRKQEQGNVIHLTRKS